MKITSNDIGSNTSTQQSVDSKVVELLSRLASKPLLVDKLLLSKDSGTQLLLNTPIGRLQLQMPLRSSQQLQSIVNSQNSRSPNLELLVNNKNQVQLKFPAPTLTNDQLARFANSAQPPSLSTLVFAQAKLIGSQLVKLESPVLQVQANLTRANEALLNTKVANNSQILSPQASGQVLISDPNLKGAQTIASQLNNLSPQGKLTLVSLSQSRPDSISLVQIAPASIPADKLDANQLIRNFLRHSFPSKVGLADNIQTIKNQISNLRNALTESLSQVASSANKNTINTANQIITQSNSITQLINQLTSAIRTPSLVNANNLIERISNSGNLFENKLSKANLNTENSNQPKDLAANLKPNSPTLVQSASAKGYLARNNIANNPLAATPFTQTNKVAKASTNSSQTPNATDIKLLLVQIKAQVEKLIGQLNTLVTRTGLNEPSQAAAQSQFNPSAITAEQIRKELEAATHSQLRQESSSKIDLANQSRRNFANTSHPLLSIPQTNQINKILSDLVLEVRSALTQIETNQLLSLRAEQPNLHQFLVDLPFANENQIDSFELLFEHKTETPGKSEKQWKVVVRFDLEPLGPMFAQVELKNNRISTNIFAESQPTAKLINEHLHVLQKSLFEAGIDTDKITSSQGKIPQNLVKNTEHTVDVRV